MTMRGTNRDRGRGPLVWLGVLALGAGAGCSEPLLAPTDERTQFDRYDRVRNKYAQQYQEDEYGRREPNLRARLAPKD